MAKRQADCVDGGWVERGLACDGANAIGAKEFANCCLGHMQV
jgi:hypothetical protein